jgi:hypothetical protein
MARLTKKKTEAAQAAEVATENKETLAAEAAAEVAAEAVKATEEAAKAAEEKKVKAQSINSANRAVIDTTDTVILCLNYPQDLELAIPTSKGTIERIILNGNNTHLRGKEKGINPVGAYGVTPNVPRAAWEWFCKNYPEFWLIKEHLLFCATKDDKYSVEAETDERKALRNGFEPAAKMAGPEGREGSVTPVE